MTAPVRRPRNEEGATLALKFLQTAVFTAVIFSFACLQVARAQTTVFGSNLIVNAGAESGAGGDGTVRERNVPGWSSTGGCDIYAYTTAYENVNAISPQDIVPFGAGNNYFAGGAQPANCTFSQSINMSSGAAVIDAGTATFAAAAYLGGFSSDSDNATMTVTFQDAAGKSLSSVTIGTVGPNDRASQESGLYLRRQIGQVPVGTRTAMVTLNMLSVDGANNEAYADNLSLILNAPATAKSLTGVNLIANPGADASPGFDETSTTDVSTDLPGWVRSAYLTADSYQDTDGDLYQYTRGPADAGINYFYGGVDVSYDSDSNALPATAFQDIDVSSAGSLIDAGSVTYALSGWLGGYSDQDDNTVLTVQFQSWTRAVLGTATLGPVMAADRMNQTSILNAAASGSIPKGTRVIHVLITMTRMEGANNDGLAESLSLVLGPSTKPGPLISHVISASGYGGFDSVTPGGWMEIYGENLAADTRVWGSGDFNGIIAPTSLDGTSATIGGQAAFIYFVSAGQIDALVPAGLGMGPQPVTVTTANGASAPLQVSVNPVEPGLLAPASFIVNGNQYLAALFTDGKTFVLPPGSIAGVTSRQAKPGETIVVYGSGFGAVTPNAAVGQIDQQLNSLVLPFQVMFGSTQAATPAYAGMAPSYVGLYQFNVVVPDVPDSDLVPISFTLGGEQGTQTLYTAVHN